MCVVIIHFANNYFYLNIFSKAETMVECSTMNSLLHYLPQNLKEKNFWQLANLNDA